MHTLHATGSLTASNEEAVNLKTRFNIYTALQESGLYTMFSGELWEVGQLNIDHVRTVDVNENSGQDFIDRLSQVLEMEGVKELELSGRITVTVTGAAPTVFHVLVSEGNLTHQNTTVSWQDDDIALTWDKANT